MSTEPEGSTPNSLGLDLQSLKISDEKPAVSAPTQQPPHSETSSTEVPNDGPTVVAPPDAAESPADKSEAKSPTIVKEKKKPYVNPDRVKTGGAQRVRAFQTRSRPTHVGLTVPMAG